MLAAPAALVSLLSALPAVETSERPIADARMRLVARFAPPPPLAEPGFTVVAIDAQSLRIHPDWPWPRARLAAGIPRIAAAGARAIAVDLDLSAQRDPSDDRQLAAALRSSGHVVLSALRQRERSAGDSSLQTPTLPPPPPPGPSTEA